MNWRKNLLGILVNTEEELFRYVRNELSNSNCVKTRTAAAIARYELLSNKYLVLSLGSNSCAPSGYEYGQKILSCPRSAIKTGTGYELCAPIHAERMACLNISTKMEPAELHKFSSHLKMTREGIISVFSEEELKKLNGATIYLAGHYWVCESCKYFLNVVGIKDIKFDPETAEKTRSDYVVKNIH
jgi:deoxycytidylate deaminase